MLHALGLGVTVQRVYETSTSLSRATHHLLQMKSPLGVPSVKLQHLFEMPRSVCVCCVNEKRGVRWRFASENGLVLLTVPCYFWICFLFSLHDRGRLPVFVQWTGGVCVCVHCLELTVCFCRKTPSHLDFHLGNRMSLVKLVLIIISKEEL